MPTVTRARNRAEDRSFWDYCANCGSLSAMPPGGWLCDECAWSVDAWSVSNTAKGVARSRIGGDR